MEKEKIPKPDGMSDVSATEERTVLVAVPLGAGNFFSYLVPDRIRDSVVPGTRVLVPFGSRHLVGLVAGDDPGGPRSGLKAVKTVLDKAPVLTESLVELGKWLSWYYISPPGEMFRCMLPPGLLAKKASADDTAARHWPVRKQIAIVEVLEVSAGQLTRRQEEVHRKLRSFELPLLRAGLSGILGCSEGVISKLEEKGAIVADRIAVERSPWLDLPEENPVKHELSSDQASALSQIERLIEQDGYQSVLVHGVTACGKTEIYLRAIEKVLALGRTALTLVPEIGLTPQVSQLFRERFGDKVAILHSRLSQGERFDQWLKIHNGEIRVVVGTRSAVFAPLGNLGLIVVDEEHDTSYKQGDQPRYNGRDTALKRGQLEGAVVILGSATPQLETYNNAVHRGFHHYIGMRERILSRPLPKMTVVDMAEEFRRHGRDSALSETLREKISSRLEENEQVLIFLNRRGYAAMVLCRSCGYTEYCEHCSIRLTYHQENNLLVCHYCGFSKKVPRECPQCRKSYIHYHGDGTEKVQEELEALYPSAVIDRLDRDTTRRKGGFDTILGRFRKGETDILVGTQMIAKGHDFPGVTLVGVLNGDQSLGRPDFRAVERTFQLLTQVSGRAGRGEKPGEVVIQTFNPGHYGVRSALQQDFSGFAEKELLARRRFAFPPYVALANLVIKGKNEESARVRADQLNRILRKLVRTVFSESGIRVLGPAPSAIEKLEGDFRQQIILKSQDRMKLHQLIREALSAMSQTVGNTTGIYVDIDPVDLM